MPKPSLWPLLKMRTSRTWSERARTGVPKSKSFTRRCSGPFSKTRNLKMTKTKIRFIKPDVAAVDAWWEMTGAKTREGKEIPLRQGLLNFVMTKEGGRWFITVMHNMDLPVSYRGTGLGLASVSDCQRRGLHGALSV